MPQNAFFRLRYASAGPKGTIPARTGLDPKRARNGPKSPKNNTCACVFRPLLGLFEPLPQTPSKSSCFGTQPQNSEALAGPFAASFVALAHFYMFLPSKRLGAAKDVQMAQTARGRAKDMCFSPPLSQVTSRKMHFWPTTRNGYGTQIAPK